MKRLFTILALVTAAACGGNTDTDLEAAFCAGLEAPAARTLTATADASGAPDATDAARVDITLGGAADAYSGFVKYVPDEVGFFAFGLTEDVGVVVRDSAGNEVPIASSVTGATSCTALAVRYTVALELDTYTLEIGPASGRTIGLIAEESDDDQ